MICPGDVYAGSDGFRVEVLYETPDGAGFVCRITPPRNALDSMRGSLEYYERLGRHDFVEKLVRAATKTREDVREREWFIQWLQRGLIRKENP